MKHLPGVRFITFWIRWTGLLIIVLLHHWFYFPVCFVLLCNYIAVYKFYTFIIISSSKNASACHHFIWNRFLHPPTLSLYHRSAIRIFTVTSLPCMCVYVEEWCARARARVCVCIICAYMSVYIHVCVYTFLLYLLLINLFIFLL